MLTSLRQQQTFGWTDSTIVLQWLAQVPRTWTTFAANRVSGVQVLPKSNWNHIAPSNNPADCSSRSTRLKNLKSSPLWWNGPAWLQKPQEKWPKSQIQPVEPSENRDHKKQRTSQSTTTTLHSNAAVQYTPIFQPEQNSSFTRLIRVVETVQIALDKLKRMKNPSGVSLENLTTAKWKLVRENQLKYFANEFSVLKTAGALPRQSKILNVLRH